MEIQLLTYLIVFSGVVNLLRMSLFLIGSDIYNIMAAKHKKTTIPATALPSFSVVIPARNEEGTVVRAIESVLSSNYPKDRIQIIVVDDGSTDNTGTNVQNYIASQKDTVITLVQQKNAGKAHALNNGIKNHAKGDLVMCLDADSFIKKDALQKAAKHFTDPKVVAMSSNVKIIERPGLLNFIQRYEYLVCYQMKRAESLLNCEYIIGGIGSVFRRTTLEQINYYDTNTVTEDIDITMKVINLGNKENKVTYGSDVVTYTESVMNIPDLIKQRYRWKWGRCQTFFKNRSMFFSRDMKFTKSLTMFYLPLAILGDIMYFLEPLLLTYIITISIVYQDPSALINAWIVISSYMILNILAEDTYSQKEKAKYILGAPFMYGLLYILSFVEYIALIKSLSKLHKIKESLSNTKTDWVRVDRHRENISYTPAFGRWTMQLVLILVAFLFAFAGMFTYVQIDKIVQASTTMKTYTHPKQIEIITPKPEQLVSLHVVQNGETLWKISKKYYGKGALWKNLKVANANTKLRPGDIVEVPPLETIK
ncbi:MAG: glycosyltransferase [Candidatus Levybacteria bacterium]|nr:glycosyltransferase [Candidatus Levybacteria bacterium]